MLTKSMQELIILIFSHKTIGRKDADMIYGNTRAFYKAMKYLKDCNFVVQYGGGKERVGDIVYELSIDGFLLAVLLTGIKEKSEIIRDQIGVDNTWKLKN